MHQNDLSLKKEKNGGKCVTRCRLAFPWGSAETRRLWRRCVESINQPPSQPPDKNLPPAPNGPQTITPLQPRVANFDGWLGRSFDPSAGKVWCCKDVVYIFNKFRSLEFNKGT